MDNVNVKRIKVNRKSLYLYWLIFLKPYHKLRYKEIQAMSLLLYYRFKLIEQVGDVRMAERLLFSKDIKKNIMEELNISTNPIFNNLMRDLRKKDVLSKDNIINEVLIPRSDAGSDNFKLIFNFEINETE